MKNNLFSFRAAIMALFLLVGMTAFAQTTVQGTVIDAANGEPIIGASVLEIGTTNGTITDFDGNFNLTVKPGAKLAISYMGYKTQELAAQPVMSVKLGEDSELLDEVVVVGYGVVKKNDATGSVTAIKPDEMNKGLTTNAQDMLAGKIAGVNVSTGGGSPGAGATIRIRGGSSLNASSDPLIVIDGLAMDNNTMPGMSNLLSLVNPSDIETFTVLKDASATAIYGSRASNGVILITTKKGKSGQKLKVTYDGNVSFGTVLKHLDVMTGDELRAYAMSAGRGEQANAYLMNNNVDWFKETFQTAINTDHNVSLAGGVKNKVVDMPYRASVGYTLQNGAVKGSQMQRVTGSVNLNPSFLDNHLTFNLNAKGLYIHNRWEPSNSGAYLSQDPTQAIYSTDDLTNIYGDLIEIPGSAPGTSYYITKDELDAHWGGYYQPLGTDASEYGPYSDPNWIFNIKGGGNPIGRLYQQWSGSDAGQFMGNLEATYKVHNFEDLVFHANFGADYVYSENKYVNNMIGASDHYTGKQGTEKKMKYNLQFNCFAQYGHEWEQAQQQFDVMVGYEWQHFYNDYHNQGGGLWPLTYKGTSGVPGEVAYPYINVGRGENYLVSFFGRANWIGWNQIMLTATLRADGSSRFARNNRWGIFPSVALGWKIKESFLKDVHWLSDLKLRLGYGITGQQDFPDDVGYMATYHATTGHESFYPVGGGNSYATENKDAEKVDAVTDINGDTLYAPSSPSKYNMKLRWEQTTTYNVGLDFAFLNNRISGSLDYYFRQTKDLINKAPVLMGTNFASEVNQNIGSLQNQGVEFAINAVVLDYGKRFKWDIGYNVTWNQNKITNLNGQDDKKPGNGKAGEGNGGKAITYYAVGQPTDVFYLYQARKGVKDDGSTYWYVVDTDGDGEITESDRVFKHSPVAPVTMGFQMKFQFYNFDLGMSFRANIGNYIFNNLVVSRLSSATVENLSSNKYFYNQLTSVLETYYVDGYKNSIYNPEGTELVPGVYSITDRFLEDASFLRCDNITLGYSFTTPKVSGRAYCTISNPFVITKYSGLDPEIDTYGGHGIDNSIYPRSMTTVLGINLQF